MIYGRSRLAQSAMFLIFSMVMAFLVSLVLIPLYGILPFLAVNVLGFPIIAFYLVLLNKGIVH